MTGYQVTSDNGTRDVSPVYVYAIGSADSTAAFSKGTVELWAVRDGKRLGAYPVASWLNGRRLH